MTAWSCSTMLEPAAYVGSLQDLLVQSAHGWRSRATAFVLAAGVRRDWLVEGDQAWAEVAGGQVARAGGRDLVMSDWVLYVTVAEARHMDGAEPHVLCFVVSIQSDSPDLPKARAGIVAKPLRPAARARNRHLSYSAASDPDGLSSNAPRR